MNQLIKEEARKYGDRLQIVNIKRLEDLKVGIEEFKNTEELNGFQQWIVDELYDFQLPTTDFEIRSIIIMALYHPMYAEVEFQYEGRSYQAKAFVSAEVDRARRYLTDRLSQHGYHAIETANLPMKRLAVQSGLAVFGRNNITYVEGLGSNVSYFAFYSDLPCDDDIWSSPAMADICNKCNACIRLCPTGAIREDRFLIDNQRCLSCLNEVGGDFPDWLPVNVHHTIYDCLRCQEQCPMNALVSQDVVAPISFREEETRMLLEGKGPEDFSPEFHQKVGKIALFYWKDSLARNIRAIMDATDRLQSV